MNKQLAYLFLSNLSILFVGMGLSPLLPLYAARFGATPAVIGVYMGVTYVAIALGAVLASWLSGRVPRRAAIVAAGAIGVPPVALLGQATALWQVVILTALVWFTGGVGLSLIGVLAGLHAGAKDRGEWFSLIALTTPLGAIAGGLAAGWLVETYGYPAMFAGFGAVFAGWPLIGLAGLRDKPDAPARQQARAGEDAAPAAFFHLLLAAVLLSAATASIVGLGLTLEMKADHFSARAITGANVVGGLVTIPVVWWFGKLSDRLGRKLFLTLGTCSPRQPRWCY